MLTLRPQHEVKTKDQRVHAVHTEAQRTQRQRRSAIIPLPSPAVCGRPRRQAHSAPVVADFAVVVVVLVPVETDFPVRIVRAAKTAQHTTSAADSFATEGRAVAVAETQRETQHHLQLVDRSTVRNTGRPGTER